MIKIYGIARSRAARCIWACEELGLPYELVPTTYTDDVKKPEFAALNPMQQVPVMVDGDFALPESLAINFYLARKAGRLIPGDLQGEAQVLRWSFWGITEIEPRVNQIYFNAVLWPEAQRDPAVPPKMREALERPLRVLTEQLARSPYLAGNEFSLADLNVAALFMGPYGMGYDIGMTPGLKSWLDQIFARPAAARVLAMRKAP